MHLLRAQQRSGSRAEGRARPAPDWEREWLEAGALERQGHADAIARRPNEGNDSELALRDRRRLVDPDTNRVSGGRQSCRRSTRGRRPTALDRVMPGRGNLAGE